MRVAFPEGDNETMMAACAQVAREGIARVVLVGDEDVLRALAAERGHDPASFEYADTCGEGRLDGLAERYVALPDVLLGKKAVVRRASRSALFYALFLEAVHDVDVTFAGISCSTGDVIAAAQAAIGLADGIETISSFGINDVPGWEGSESSLLGFGDAAVCQNPTAEQLASIAISACDTAAALLDWEPRCALLSYSTDGSGMGELVDKVRTARDIANALRPDLKIDGEFQLDAAVNPTTAAHKVRRPSEVAGRANIVICPDLNAGNIGVKLVQQFAHANSYGPMLQGFKKVVCDCSRSAPVSEIVGNVAISCVRAQSLGA